MVYDIGGTFVKYAFVSQTGDVKTSGKFETPYVDTLTLIDKMVTVAKDFSDLKGVAISCPCTIELIQGLFITAVPSHIYTKST